MGNGETEVATIIAANANLIGAASTILGRVAFLAFALLKFYVDLYACHYRTRGITDCARNGDPVLALGC